MQTQEPKKTTPLEQLILLLKGQKSRSEADELTVLLYDNNNRTKEEERQLYVLLKAARAKTSARKAALAATKLLGAKGEAERKARNHRLIQQGLLIDFASMNEWSRGELLGGLMALANTKPESRIGWEKAGNTLLASKEAR